MLKEIKKIFPLFLLLIITFALPVHADKEYKFKINKTLENKQIIYEWENHIDNFSFQMISPSNQTFELGIYDLIEYNEESNKVIASFNSLESGQWKVIFKGDSTPVGLKNQIIDYYPSEESPASITESTNETTSETKKDIIIIGAPTPEPTIEPTIKPTPEETTTEEEIIIEEIDEETKAKEELAKQRESERTKALESKKEKRLEEKELKEQQAEIEETEITLNMQEPIETPTPVVEETENVIILGTDENATPQTISVEKNEADINMVNINADEERAKIENQIKAEKTSKTIKIILMITPLIIVTVLFILNLVPKKNKKQ